MGNCKRTGKQQRIAPEVTRGRKEKTMKREQIFDTAHDAFVILNNYTKHGWHGYVEKCGDKFKLVICC